MPPEPEQDRPRLSAYTDRDRVIAATWPGTDTLAPVEFDYRPLNAIDNGRYIRLLAQAQNAEKVFDVVRKMLSKHLVAWDVTKGDGQAVDCHDPDELGRIDGNVLFGIQKIVEKSAQTLEEASKNS